MDDAGVSEADFTGFDTAEIDGGQHRQKAVWISPSRRNLRSQHHCPSAFVYVVVGFSGWGWPFWNGFWPIILHRWAWVRQCCWSYVGRCESSLVASMGLCIVLSEEHLAASVQGFASAGPCYELFRVRDVLNLVNGRATFVFEVKRECTWSAPPLDCRERPPSKSPLVRRKF